MGLAEVLVSKGEALEAVPLLNEALKIRKDALPENHWLIAYAQSVRGECLAALGRYDEAEPLIVESYERVALAQGEKGFESVRVLRRIVRLYEAWDAAAPGEGHDAQAAAWRDRLQEQKNSPGE